jgi:hypothetical protein
MGSSPWIPIQAQNQNGMIPRISGRRKVSREESIDFSRSWPAGELGRPAGRMKQHDCGRWNHAKAASLFPAYLGALLRPLRVVENPVCASRFHPSCYVILWDQRKRQRKMMMLCRNSRSADGDLCVWTCAFEENAICRFCHQRKGTSTTFSSHHVTTSSNVFTPPQSTLTTRGWNKDFLHPCVSIYMCIGQKT